MSDVGRAHRTQNNRDPVTHIASLPFAPIITAYVAGLEEQFQRHLADTWSVGARDKSESRAVEITTGFVELCVVEDVEKFSAQFEPEPFVQPEVFEQRHVEVVDARAVKEALVRVSETSNGFLSEQ